MEFFLALLFLFIGYQILIMYLELAIALIGYLLGILCELALNILTACYEALWFFLKLIGGISGKSFKWGKTRILAIVIFSYFLIAEALGGKVSQTDDDKKTEADDQDSETDDNFAKQEAPNNAYEDALKLLGLQAGCTPETANIAFKKAMTWAHPDKGGTHEMALAVNAARNIIKTQNDWR